MSIKILNFLNVIKIYMLSILDRRTRVQNRPSNTNFNPRKTIGSNDNVSNADVTLPPRRRPPVWTKKRGHLKRERRQKQTLPPLKEGGKYRRTRKRKTHKRKGRKGRKGRKTYRKRR